MSGDDRPMNSAAEGAETPAAPATPAAAKPGVDWWGEVKSLTLLLLAVLAH